MSSSQTYEGRKTAQTSTDETAVRAVELLGDWATPMYAGTIEHDGKVYHWKGSLPGFSLFGGGRKGTYLVRVQRPCHDVSVYNATPEQQRTLAQLVVRHYDALHDEEMALRERGGHP